MVSQITRQEKTVIAMVTILTPRKMSFENSTFFFSDQAHGAVWRTAGGAQLRHIGGNSTMEKIKGIDVSKWQGAIDWAKVAGDGVKFPSPCP